MSLADDIHIASLTRYIGKLEEELRQLREDLVPVNNPFLHLFSYQHSALLLGIYSKRLATYAYLDAICSRL